MALPPGRTLAIIGLTAVVSLGAGLGLSRLVISPAENAAHASPPAAGPITVPVESRALSNDVVMRGDATYEDPVDVKIETGDLGGPAVVTGQVPAEGTTVDAGQVILEIAGRPVILLAGDLPVYRTLRAGVSGPDVLQLKAALAALGIDPGNATSDAYDAATAKAVAALYQRVGYPTPGAGKDATGALTSAQEGVHAAEEQVAAAQRELTAAKAGTPNAERVRLQAAVDTAKAKLDEVNAACAADPATCLHSDVVAAQGEVAAAQADLDAALRAPDTSAQQAALTAAQRGLADARTALTQAQQGVLTPLPAGEVVFLPTTPRRVDSVAVARGAIVSGTAVMSVSGAALRIEGTVLDSDAALVAEGAAVSIALPDGTAVPGTIAKVGGESTAPGAKAPPAGRTRLVVSPGELTDEQRQGLQGANVRVTIPVGSTNGKVLAVPAAALTAGPGGEARVEVLEKGVSRLVTVTTGLAADGFVEVKAADGSLAKGDLVVVGTSGSDEADTGKDAGKDGKDGGSESSTPSSDESSAESGSGKG